MPNSEHLRKEAAHATWLSEQGLDPLTRERLQALAADYFRQAIELESSGQTVPPDSDPTG